MARKHKTKEASAIVPKGFPVEIFSKIQRELTQAQPQRGLAFQTERQKNTQFLQKGLTKPGKISYDTLRRASLSVHIARICINTLKEKITKTKWVIQQIDITKRKDQSDKRIKEVTDLFKHPNQNNETFRTLLDKMLEDLLVLDAVSIEKTRFQDGKLAELYFVDSATIRPVYDDHGNQDIEVPLDTEKHGPEMLPVSYLQIINNSQYGGPESGDIVAAWPKRDFIHFHQHPQGAMEAYGYGLSPLEGVLSVVSNLLNADNYNGTYFQEGAFPPVIIQLVGQINQRDLEAYREYMLQELAGEFHRPAIMAGQQKAEVLNLKSMTNRDMEFMDYQNWLARLLCAAYGLAPQDIGLTDEVGSKNVSETQKQLSEGKGYGSILHLIKEIMNQEIIWKDFGYEDLEFDWAAPDSSDPDIASQTYDRMLKNGTITLNEVRQKQGEAPYESWADEPMILTPTGYVPMKSEENPENELNNPAPEKGPNDQVIGGEKPYDEQDKKKDVEKSLSKSVYTQGGYKTWADDRGYSQPFIYMDIKSGKGRVIKPPAAVNMDSQNLEIEITRDLHDMGLNVNPVTKMTYVEVVNSLRSVPEILAEFEKYCSMTTEYDSEKWKSKYGASRKFSYYLVSDFIEGLPLSNPLLQADMDRDPQSYEDAISDLANLWKTERDMVLGDRRSDQYIIGHDKRAYGFDYQFKGDVERWEKTKDSITFSLARVPELQKLFKRMISGAPVTKSWLKKVLSGSYT